MVFLQKSFPHYRGFENYNTCAQKKIFANRFCTTQEFVVEKLWIDLKKFA